MTAIPTTSNEKYGEILQQVHITTSTINSKLLAK